MIFLWCARAVKMHIDRYVNNPCLSNVLLILGDNDDSIPLSEVIRLRKNVQNSDLWILPNSPHSAYEENISEFIRVSKEFFKDK